eukprot:gnl/MRDRNA2_/MRDRNA2_32069_c0_seq1.p1 gnl/MRDRNA2_/MRDRNA2_32069_c0~~gnl/MRDRNA2_/MRDRNA2_32069_c0_seq1.p1  ORF type:complete len:731 (-),score=99.82 gnl/MRDRNA2_/MRDRNA2_32069_c0_seq1:189-2381(-)
MAQRESNERSWHKVQQVRVQSGYDLFSLVPLEVPTPSVVSFAVWSEFAAHHVRAALKTEEGLWVGEQRGTRGSLEIELPPGRYDLQVQEVSPVFIDSGLSRCISFGIAITMASMMPPIGILKTGKAPIMSKSCAGLGASGLPLDFVTPGGGSQTLGGPVDSNGRMLVRRSVMLTDIHDGRKKVFLKLMSTNSLFRILIGGEQASEVEVLLEDAIAHTPVVPVAIGRYGDVRTIAYRMKSDASTGFWLSFHREHRLATATGCASFDLLAQLNPVADFAQMTKCPKRGGLSLKQAIQKKSTEIFLVEVKGPATETIDVSASSDSVVFVEVEFNILLSDVRLWVTGLPTRPKVGPEVSAASGKTSLTNARITLKLGVGIGSYEVKLRHALTFADENTRCVPLRIRKEVHPLDANTIGAFVPAKPAPLAFGGDLVMTAHLGNNAYRGTGFSQLDPNEVSVHGLRQLTPKVGGEAPSAIVEYAGIGLWMWDYVAIKRLAGATSTRGGQKCWVLPFCVDNKCIELDVAANWDRGDPPWSGGGSSVQDAINAGSGAKNQDLENPLDKIDILGDRDEAVRESRDDVDVDRSRSSWDPDPVLKDLVPGRSLPRTPKSMSPQHPSDEESMLNGSAWIAVFCLGAAFMAWRYPHVVETYARKYLPPSLIRSGLSVYHGGTADSSSLFGSSATDLELTNPATGAWSWDTGSGFMGSGFSGHERSNGAAKSARPTSMGSYGAL